MAGWRRVERASCKERVPAPSALSVLPAPHSFPLLLASSLPAPTSFLLSEGLVTCCAERTATTTAVAAPSGRAAWARPRAGRCGCCSRCAGRPGTAAPLQAVSGDAPLRTRPVTSPGARDRCVLGGPGVPLAHPLLGGASPRSSPASPPRPGGASELSESRLLGDGPGGWWGLGCPKASLELVVIPLCPLSSQNLCFTWFSSPFDKGLGMWALEPLNNGSASSARRAVRTVAEHGAWKPGCAPQT